MATEINDTQDTDTQNTGTPTPEKVERLATQEVRLGRTALIGIFGKAETPRALIRLPDGETHTLRIGDTLDGGTVDAIGSDILVLTRRGTQHVMQMPKG